MAETFYRTWGFRVIGEGRTALLGLRRVAGYSLLTCGFHAISAGNHPGISVQARFCALKLYRMLCRRGPTRIPLSEIQRSIGLLHILPNTSDPVLVSPPKN